MVIGRMIRLMVLVNTLILMELNMKDIGLMTNSMDKEKSIGQMVLNMKVHINMERKMVLVNSYGLINHHIVVLLLITIFTGMVNIDGLIIESILVIGLTIKCMELVFLLGLTEENMKEIISMTKSKVMVYSRGQMGDNMTVTG